MSIGSLLERTDSECNQVDGGGYDGEDGTRIDDESEFITKRWRKPDALLPSRRSSRWRTLSCQAARR